MPEFVRCKVCKANVPKTVRKDNGKGKKPTYTDNVGKDGVCVACMEKAVK